MTNLKKYGMIVIIKGENYEDYYNYCRNFNKYFCINLAIFEMIAKENQENEKNFENFSKTLDNDKSDMV